MKLPMRSLFSCHFVAALGAAVVACSSSTSTPNVASDGGSDAGAVDDSGGGSTDSGADGGGAEGGGADGSTADAGCDLNGTRGYMGTCTQVTGMNYTPECGGVMRCIAKSSSSPTLCEVFCKSDAACIAVGAGTCPAATCPTCNRTCTSAPTKCP